MRASYRDNNVENGDCYGVVLTDGKGLGMAIYQLKLFVYFFNIGVYGDISLDEDLQNIQYWDQDLAKLGVPGTIILGKTFSSLTVAANNSESVDPRMLRKVEVIVDVDAARRDDAFFEYVMPIGDKGLLIDQVAESDVLPIVNHEDVYVPVPWVGPSTIQLIAPDGFYRHPEGTYLVESLRVVVSPEFP